MNDAGTTLSDPAEIDPLAKVPAWARGRMLRHLELLDEACEVGAKTVRAVGRRVDEDPGVDVEAAARAYAKASRALRQTVMLQAKLMRDIERWGEDDQAWAEREAHSQVRAMRIVGRIADYDAEGDERFVKEAQERAEDLLDDEDLYGEIQDRPLSEVVAQLCEDIGLDPDWRRIAAEPWAQKEIAAGQACAALVAVTADNPRPPPQAGEVSRSEGGGVPPPLSFEPVDLFPAPA